MDNVLTFKSRFRCCKTPVKRRDEVQCMQASSSFVFFENDFIWLKKVLGQVCRHVLEDPDQHYYQNSKWHEIELKT